MLGHTNLVYKVSFNKMYLIYPNMLFVTGTWHSPPQLESYILLSMVLQYVLDPIILKSKVNKK